MDAKFAFKYQPFTVGTFQTEGEVIGQGSFAHVLRGINFKTGEPVAMKIMKAEWMQNHSKSWRQQLDREITVLTQMIHPNCVRLLSMAEHPSTKALVFVFEFCDGGDLEGWLTKAKAENRLSERNAQYFMFELSQALDYLKTCGVIHRDLKPANLLLKRKDPNSTSLDADAFILKIADFGLSRQLSSPYEMAATFCGTKGYMAPEVANSEQYSFMSDLYSCGVIMYRLLFGTLPAKLHPTATEVAEALKGKPFSENCKNLLIGLLQPDQRQRIPWQSFLLHPWIEKPQAPSAPAPAPAPAPKVLGSSPTNAITRASPPTNPNLFSPTLARTSSNPPQPRTFLDHLVRLATWVTNNSHERDSHFVLWLTVCKMAIEERRVEIIELARAQAITARSLLPAPLLDITPVLPFWTTFHNSIRAFCLEAVEEQIKAGEQRDLKAHQMCLERYDFGMRMLKYGQDNAPIETLRKSFAVMLALMNSLYREARSRAF